jgi:Ni/Co efflux regulator RcnB
LPLLFLGSQYFFDSYADYGIGPPPYGFRWVRYGPDLLLVSDRTGRIRQVIYGVFY